MDTSSGSQGDFYLGQRASEEYEYRAEAPLHNHAYLVPALLKTLGPSSSRSVLDLGCGNGSLTVRLSEAGFDTTGGESSQSGLDLAKRSYPELRWVDQDIDDTLSEDLMHRFDLVLAAEVIEHLFLPRNLFDRADEALTDDGLLIVTTPFHGYWKNLALALTNKFDFHMRPGWDYGHIKFFSVATLTELAREKNFEPISWTFVGRVKPLAKTMIMIAKRA